MTRVALIFVGLAALLAVSATLLAGQETVAPQVPPVQEVAYSNVRSADYVGPTVCGECHEERYEQWQGNLHRQMNRLASEPGAVLGDFGGVREAFAGGSGFFETRDGVRLMTVQSDGHRRRFRITRTIGARYLQEYVGIQIEGPEPDGDPAYETEVRLPFGYWIKEQRWFHQRFFDSWWPADHVGDPYDQDATPWRGRCAWCHNTYPFELRVRRTQGPQRRGAGIEQFFDDRSLGTQSWTAEIDENLLPGDKMVSVGISCESCHLGGREHAVDENDISFLPRGQGIEKVPGAPHLGSTRYDSTLINAICAQCHSGPSPLYASGAASRNSSEALDLLSGECASQIRCTHCHDPHIRGAGAMAATATEHLDACTACHQLLAPKAAAREHSRHRDVDCLDCHMPRIVQGFRDPIRSHQISSPSNLDMLKSGGPNACNLCHLDKSIRWTADSLREGWSVAGVDASAWTDSYDSLDRAMGLVWLASDDRMFRLTAAGAYGRSALGSTVLSILLSGLEHPRAYDRMRYLFAVQDILGRRLSRDEFEPAAPASRRAEQVRALVRDLVP